MKVTLIQSEFIEATLDKDFVDYKVNSNEAMSQQDFIDVMRLITESLVKLHQQGEIEKKSLKILIDVSKGKLIVIPETQEYIDKHYFSQLISLSKKLAILPSKELFSQVATELLMDEDNSKQFNTRYFQNKEEALIWLNT